MVLMRLIRLWPRLDCSHRTPFAGAARSELEAPQVYLAKYHLKHQPLVVDVVQEEDRQLRIPCHLLAVLLVMADHSQQELSALVILAPVGLLADRVHHSSPVAKVH